MDTKHLTSTPSEPLLKLRRGTWRGGGDNRSTVKRVQTFSQSELAAMFGVRASELGRLARMGLIQRIGVDRFLVDHRQSALLLSKQENPLLAGAALRNSRTTISAPYRRTGNWAEEHVLFQSIADFYHSHNGFLDNSVNLVKVPELQHATLLAGMFLEDGLRGGERVVVLSFEHPDMLLARFAEAGLLFADALDSEQLVYLYYKPDVAHSISLSVDYRGLFGEVERLSSKGVKRLVLFNVDALINANSEHLVHTSLHQLIYAVNHFEVVLLGLFVASGHVAESLDEGCRAILPGYFVMEHQGSAE